MAKRSNSRKILSKTSKLSKNKLRRWRVSENLNTTTIDQSFSPTQMCECKCGRCHDNQNGDESRVIETNADGFKIATIDTFEKEITVLASVQLEKDNEDNENGIFDRLKIKINSCSICHGVLRIGQIKSTVCGHVFCGVCVDTAVRFRKNCPLCAQPVSTNDSHLLFV